MPMRLPHVFEHDRPAVPAHLDLVRGRLAARERNVEVAPHEQAEAVDAQDFVALLHAALQHRAARVDAPDGRNDVAAASGRLHRKHQNEQTDGEIHQRTCRHDEDAAAQTRLAEGVLVFTFAVLALHDARAADRQQLQAVHRAMIFVLENGRAQADPEFIDLHAAALGGDKMAEFMHDDQHAEGQNGQND